MMENIRYLPFFPYNDGKYQISALFSDSETRVESPKFEKALIWERHLPGLGGLGNPIVSGDIIFVPLVDDQMSVNCGVVALDKNSGQQVWFYKTSGSVRNNMALEEGLLFVSDVNSVLYALNPQNGELVWSYKFRTDGG